jgi:hypothetical protein
MNILQYIIDLTFSAEGIDQAYFFFFLVDPFKDEDYKNEPKAVTALSSWLAKDDFNNSTSTSLTSDLIRQLNFLKFEFISYFKENLNTLTQKNPEESVHHVYTRISNYFVQVMRLRLIIEPEYQLTINKHARTKIVYLVMKSFWIDDDGRKKRLFYKAFAREDAYKNGRKSKKALTDGIAIIQKLMYEKYKDIYGA